MSMDWSNDAPPCPVCKAPTRLNVGRNYRPFYGCTSWRRDDPNSCQGKVEVRPPRILLEAVLASLEGEVPWRWVDLDRVDKMGGAEFEKYLAGLLLQTRFRPEVIGGSGDRGADIVLRAPNGQLWVIQAKRWGQGQKVGTRAIMEVIAARAFYRADHAVVITNQGFTRDTAEWEAKTGVELWGRGTLVQAIRVLEYASEIKGQS